jgi:ribonuclease HII
MVSRTQAAMPSQDQHGRDTAAGILAGVDEAGLGPVLGPLVVAGVAMVGPRGADPWKLLRRVVCRRHSKKGKIRVADSKKVNQGPHGRQYLERTVLSFWGARKGDLPATLAELLEEAGVPLAPLERCPWYSHLDLRLPLDNNRDELELKSHLLARTMERRQIHIQHMALRPVDAAEFNDLIAETDNKSHAHFHAYSAVIAELLRVLEGQEGQEDAHLVADRCGGRFRYRRGLEQHLGGRRIQILEEHPDFSSYLIHTTKGSGKGHDLAPVRISFAARGEDRAFPTALASCAAKYVRELMMECLNRWFSSRIPGLRRTAGYYVDGNRFLEEVESITTRREFPMEWLRRVR